MSEASDPVPSAATSPELSAPEPYRPLSILALIGFVVGVLYALIVVVGGLVALFQRKPWLLPAWVFLVPVGAALLAWMARTRIRDSEGTLGGLALTRWAIGLSLVTGLLYGAYYAATYAAVRQQAGVVSEQFVKALREGRMDEAFLLTLQPLERESARANPRTFLEVSHNIPGRNDAGEFSSFKQAKFVRYLQAGGEKTNVRALGIKSWGYDPKGYQVILVYHVETPLVGFDLEVMVLGKDVRTGAVKGRQWHVFLDNTGITNESERMTQEGIAFLNLSMAGLAHANKWMGMAESGRWEDMYFGTLPSSERQRLRRANDLGRLGEAAAVIGPAPLALQDASSQELSRGYEAFAHGSIVRADPNTFWAPEARRDEIIKKVKTLFDPSKPWRYRFRVPPNRIPGWSRENGELIYSFPISFTVMDIEKKVPEYLLEANLRVAIPEDKVSQAPPPWRIVDLELVSGRSAPAPGEMGRPDTARPSIMGMPGGQP